MVRVRYSFGSRHTGRIANIAKQRKEFPKIVEEVISMTDIIIEVIDARFISKLFGFFIDITFLTKNEIYTKKYKKIVINCKSPHYYFLDDFLPLKKDKFEDIELYVPNKIENVLVYEYGKKVFLPKFQNWIFKDNLWIREK